MGLTQTVGSDLIPGTLDMLILKTVSRAPMHGYAVAQSILEVSEDVLRLQEGALYPALHRLEVRGLLRSSWGVSENNRRAKFYQLTRAGKKQVGRETRDWEQTQAILARFLAPDEA